MKLTDCLTKNRDLLGSNCENLGKTKHSCSSWNSKTLLSYKNGWKVLELNRFQLFLRKIFGAYKSTHLNHITENIFKLKEIEITEKTKTCQEKIVALWAKKNLIGLGNSNLSESTVIGVAEDHTDECFRAAVAYLFNARFNLKQEDGNQKGDIILVEGLEVGKEKKREDHCQTKYLKSECMVRGWEPKNFESLNGSSFKKSEEKYEELVKGIKHFEDIKTKKDFTEAELAALKIKLDEFVEKINNLNKYYKSKSEKVLNAGKILEYSFEKLKNKMLSSEIEKQGLVLYAVIINILQELEKNQEKALHKNMTHKEKQQIMKAIKKRNASLIAEINKYREEGHRVFIFAGASHLLQFPKPYRSCKAVKECLHKNKFTIVTKRQFFKTRFKQLNPELKKFSLN